LVAQKRPVGSSAMLKPPESVLAGVAEVVAPDQVLLEGRTDQSALLCSQARGSSDQTMVLMLGEVDKELSPVLN
jgi:hypothetical protein